jgi:hypothetical protein
MAEQPSDRSMGLEVDEMLGVRFAEANSHNAMLGIGVKKGEA